MRTTTVLTLIKTTGAALALATLTSPPSAATIDDSDLPRLLEDAIAHHANGELEPAMTLLERAHDEAPGNADVHWRIGRLLWDMGHEQGALASHERAVELEPDHGMAWLYLGSGRHQLGQTSSALEALDRAASLLPESPTPPVLRGRILDEMGLASDALTAFEKAADLAPDDAGVHVELGSLERRAGHWEAALAAFDRAASLAPGDEVIRAHRAMIYDWAAPFGVDDPDFQRRHALALLARDDVEAAVAAAQRGVDIQSTIPGQTLLARTLLAADRAEDALHALQPIESLLSPDDTDDRYWWLANEGSVLFRLKRYEDALARAQEALAVEEHSVAMRLAADTLTWLDRREEAVPLYRRARALSPDQWILGYSLGSTLGYLKRWPEARRELEHAIECAPGYARARSRLGEVLLAQGDKAGAMRRFDEALAIDPKDAAAKRHLAKLRPRRVEPLLTPDLWRELESSNRHRTNWEAEAYRRAVEQAEYEVRLWADDKAEFWGAIGIP